MFHFFKKYQDLHFKRVPYDPKTEERWEVYRKEQEEKMKKQAEEKKKMDEELKKAEEERKLHPEAAPKVEAAPKEEAPKVVEQPTKPVDEKFKKISTYNGDTLDRYSWGQGVWDVTVQVELPPGTKPKMVRVHALFLIAQCRYDQYQHQYQTQG